MSAFRVPMSRQQLC